VETELRSDAAPGRSLKKKLVTVDKILREEYEISRELYEYEILDPLSDLVHGLLSHRTRYEDNDRAFNRLAAHFGGDDRIWERVRDAPLWEITKLIRGVTWPEQKANSIQAVLRKISEIRGGNLSLEFLKEMTVREARDWLERLPGVGPKTSAIVLLYSTLKMPALVIDTHHYRVSMRLGFIPTGVPVNKAEPYLLELIPKSWGAREYSEHHLALFRHGQDCCFFTGPACGRCPVLKYCPFGQSRIRV
jgi:endonuclease III